MIDLAKAAAAADLTLLLEIDGNRAILAAFARAIAEQQRTADAALCDEYAHRCETARDGNRAQHFVGAAIGSSRCADIIRGVPIEVAP